MDLVAKRKELTERREQLVAQLHAIAGYLEALDDLERSEPPPPPVETGKRRAR